MSINLYDIMPIAMFEDMVIREEYDEQIDEYEDCFSIQHRVDVPEAEQE